MPPLWHVGLPPPPGVGPQKQQERAELYKKTLAALRARVNAVEMKSGRPDGPMCGPLTPVPFPEGGLSIRGEGVIPPLWTLIQCCLRHVSQHGSHAV